MEDNSLNKATEASSVAATAPTAATQDNGDHSNPTNKRKPFDSQNAPKHDNKKLKKQKNPRRDKRMKLMDGGGGEEDENAVATINKGSLAYPDMQLPQFGYVPEEVTHTAEEQAALDEAEDSNTNTVKRRVALVIGFVGSRYHGFQMQPQYRTLQATLEYALYRAKFISHSNFGVPFKYGWSHSARTDRGVHAAAHVCSCKLQVPANSMSTTSLSSTTTTTTSTASDKAADEPEKEKDQNEKKVTKSELQLLQEEADWYDAVIREQINASLPDDIRVFQVIRTTRNFCAKNARDQVRYQYWFPSFILMPEFDAFWKTHFGEIPTPTVLTTATTGAAATNGGNSSNEEEEAAATRSTTVTGPPTPTLEQWHKCRTLVQDYRVSDEQLQVLQQAMRTYQGTHSFHNFTKGMESGKAQALRFIIDCSVQKRYMAVPTVTTGSSSDEQPAADTSTIMMEWISADIVGQSFLLNQIRKMMSMAVDIARGKAPLSTLSRMLERQPPRKHNDDDDNGASSTPLFRVGVAPAQGLFLDLSYYNSYNRKCKNLKLQPLLDDWAQRERKEGTAATATTTTTTATTTTKPEDGFQRWQSFKNTVILPHLVQEEWEQGNFLKYLVQQEYAFDHVTHYQLAQPPTAAAVTNEVANEPPKGDATNTTTE